MKIYVATIEWGGDEEVDVLAATTGIAAEREALVRLAAISKSRVDMAEGEPLFKARPLTPEEAEAMDDYLVHQYLSALHEIATVPWVSITETDLVNGVDPNVADSPYGYWDMQVNLGEFGL